MTWIIEFLLSPWGTKIRQAQFLLAILIFAALVLIPNPAKVGLVHYNDLTLHFIGNVLLLLSTWSACLERFKPNRALIFAIPFSIAMEVAQSFVAVRTTQTMDFVANLSGIFTGYIIACLIHKWLINKYLSQAI